MFFSIKPEQSFRLTLQRGTFPDKNCVADIINIVIPQVVKCGTSF